MSKSEIAKRYGLFIISLLLCAFGVAMAKHAELGVSPISSVENILSCRYEALTLGTWLVIWNVMLIIGQIALLRKEFQPVQLLQIPLSFLFGIFTDAALACIELIPAELYSVKLILTGAGVVVVGFGIMLAVTANVVMNSGEAFVKALSDKTGKAFGNLKIAFDIGCVALAVVLSLVFFDGSIVGTREGTIIAAVLTGVFVKLFGKKLKEPVERVLTAQRKKSVFQNSEEKMEQAQ